MRISQLRGQVEAEFHIVLDDRVTDLDVVGRAFLIDLLLQKGLDGGVEFRADVLNQNWSSVPDTAFKVLEVAILREFHNFDLIVLAEIADPFVSLALRVNEQRPSARGLRDDGVFDREIVRGELL